MVVQRALGTISGEDGIRFDYQFGQEELFPKSGEDG